MMIALCIIAFLAGFVDAVVGGGGLIQTPAALVLLPQYPVATVIGTLKIPAFSGTSVAAYQYAKKVKLNYPLLALMAAIAFTAAFCGSKLLTMVSNSFMKPLLLIVLVLVAIYTYTNKKFGTHTEKQHSQKQQWWYAAGISLLIRIL